HPRSGGEASLTLLRNNTVAQLTNVLHSPRSGRSGRVRSSQPRALARMRHRSLLGAAGLARASRLVGPLGALSGALFRVLVGAVARILETAHAGLAVQADELTRCVGADHEAKHRGDLEVVALLIEQSCTLHLRYRGADLLGEARLVCRGGAAIGGER